VHADRKENIMAKPATQPSATSVQAWLRIPDDIEQAIGGLSDDALNERGGENAWSIRETVHHLVEANLVASNIIIAALTKREPTYDWSWVNPDAAWMRQVGYDKAPIGPAIATLRALTKHIAGLIETAPNGLQRKVKLLDAPGAKLYSKSIEAILQDEVEHSKDHLRDVQKTRASH
jgi:hypothetical protein